MSQNLLAAGGTLRCMAQCEVSEEVELDCFNFSFSTEGLSCPLTVSSVYSKCRN